MGQWIITFSHRGPACTNVPAGQPNSRSVSGLSSSLCTFLGYSFPMASNRNLIPPWLRAHRTPQDQKSKPTTSCTAQRPTKEDQPGTKQNSSCTAKRPQSTPKDTEDQPPQKISKVEIWIHTKWIKPPGFVCKPDLNLFEKMLSYSFEERQKRTHAAKKQEETAIRNESKKMARWDMISRDRPELSTCGRRPPPKFQMGQTVHHYWASWMPTALQPPKQISNKGVRRPLWFNAIIHGPPTWKKQKYGGVLSEGWFYHAY